MEYLRQFADTAAYNAAKSGGLLSLPTVSLIKDDMSVMYDPYVAPELPYVDLGLPSGILWMRTNIGAEIETEAGNYYQWGSVTPLHLEGTTVNPPADWDHCPYCTSDSPTFSKYNDTDGLETLEASDDIVTATYGQSYRMPTSDEFTELRNETNISTVILEGLNCIKFTNKSDSDKYIILPVAGYCEFSELKSFNEHGVYWSSNRTSWLEQHAQYLASNTESASVGSISRFRAGSIRGVYDPS